MAVQANELRIGNWVMGYTEPSRVIATQTDAAAFSESEYEYGLNWRGLENIHPIPLTPEILERCGFVRKGRCATIHSGYKLTVSDALYVDGYGGDDGLSLQVAGVCGAEVGVGIQYLHQLQNLYYALTGTELEISLP